MALASIDDVAWIRATAAQVGLEEVAVHRRCLWFVPVALLLTALVVVSCRMACPPAPTPRSEAERLVAAVQQWGWQGFVVSETECVLSDGSTSPKEAVQLSPTPNHISEWSHLLHCRRTEIGWSFWGDEAMQEQAIGAFGGRR